MDNPFLLYILQGKLKIITCLKLTDRLRLIVRIFTNVLNHRSRASCRKNSYSQPVPILPTACQLFLNKVIHISSS